MYKPGDSNLWPFASRSSESSPFPTLKRITDFVTIPKRLPEWPGSFVFERPGMKMLVSDLFGFFCVSCYSPDCGVKPVGIVSTSGSDFGHLQLKACQVACSQPEPFGFGTCRKQRWITWNNKTGRARCNVKVVVPGGFEWWVGYGDLLKPRFKCEWND